MNESLTWHKSSYSDNQCLEVACTPLGMLVRDSKDTDGGHLALSTAAWSRFTASAATMKHAPAGI